MTDHHVALSVSETEHGILVRLRLPFQEDGETLTVEKIYNRDTDIIHVGATPAFAVWPDFYSEEWFENFAIYAALATVEIGVAPLLNDGERLQYVSPAGRNRPVFCIWPSRKPPVGFVLYAREQGVRQPQAIGLVLRDRYTPPEVLNTARSWTVAVDFGTSNTHIMLREPGGDPRPLLLKGRTVLLTEAEETSKAMITDGFYPLEEYSEEIRPPFATVLVRGSATVLSAAGGSTLDFFPSFLFYPERAESRDIVKNVKWGARGGRTEDAPLQGYLSSIVRYVVCEAHAKGVRQLHFEWSYPLSLSRGAHNAMAAFWHNVGQDMVHPDSMTINQIPTNGLSESEALCRYLAAKSVLPVRANALSIAVDIGGGSSDIGFWSNASLNDQVSLKLAGNDLLPPLCRLPDFPEALFKICTGRPWDPVWEANFEKFPELMCSRVYPD